MQVGGTESSVDRSRRRWRLHQQGQRRRIAVAFEAVAGSPRADPDAVQIDYRGCGLTLDYAERRAIGAALGVLDRAERAA